MVQLSNISAQTLNNGQTITFDRVLLKSGCGESCGDSAARASTGAKLAQIGIYEIAFHGNISSGTAAAPISLAIQVNGVTMPETVMTVTPGATGQFFSVSAVTLVRNAKPCCGIPSAPNVSVVATTTGATTTINVAPESTLIIKRISG